MDWSDRFAVCRALQKVCLHAIQSAPLFRQDLELVEQRTLRHISIGLCEASSFTVLNVITVLRRTQAVAPASYRFD